MAICMSVAASHIHNGACDRAAALKANGRFTTMIGIRMPDEYALKVRELAAQYDSVNDFMLHLIRTQALRTR